MAKSQKGNLSTRLNCVSGSQHLVLWLLFFFFFLEVSFHVIMHCSMGPVHCARDLQTSFFNKTFIKNWSHGTIHTFKNYFAIMFSVFGKISSIQTDSKKQHLSTVSKSYSKYKQSIHKSVQTLVLVQWWFLLLVMTQL